MSKQQIICEWECPDTKLGCEIRDGVICIQRARNQGEMDDAFENFAAHIALKLAGYNPEAVAGLVEAVKRHEDSWNCPGYLRDALAKLEGDES